ncbi:MAG: fibronectin/fibrinogen-binding protein [Ruminococcaceae bacterium]|nr:fibronectin/fibrinogen-binding protein [Oscillospiraceae bacterium]
MPLDSVTMSALAQELRGQIVGAKIDKVQQPERDTVLLSLRGQQGNFRLVLCGGVGCARVHITEASYENPAQPPMFCMLLRKHLCGARIFALEQPERERILLFRLDAYDEMGLPVKKTLAVEMIGRGTNIILVDGDGRVIDCLRRVDSDMSALRQVLPGLIYRLPLQQTKPDFFSATPEQRAALLAEYDGTVPADKWLLDTFSCLSPLICRELAYRSGDDPSRLGANMEALAGCVAAGDYTPYMLLAEGKPKDFSFMRILQYGAAMEGEAYPSFSALLDIFYTSRSKAEEMHRRTAVLRKTVKNAHDRVAKKYVLQLEDLKKTAQREQKRRWGDLITANLYRAPKTGAERMTVEDFYEDGCPSVEIPLNKLKSPQQNAAAYYREYNKAKTAERYLTKLIEENRREEQYLASVLHEIDRAACEADIADIRRELTETGYIRPQKNAKKERSKESAPLRYVSGTGVEILVGRSNVQNDRLTTKIAEKGDMWLHTQKIHGSHVIIRCAGADVDEQTLCEAASLAAYHSQASGGGKVPVDYTRVKYVKKPAGSLPGMVIYTDYSTISAEADEALAEKLKA